jgi:transposase
MKSKKLLCGIDVSKNKLDICYNDMTGKTYSIKVDNTAAGHKELIKKLGKNRTYVMESTGKYSPALCVYLKKANIDVRVESGLVIKRFIQMNMERNKNDKKDARWIYTYGLEREPTVWRMPSKEYFYCMQLLGSIDLYIKQLTMLSNHTDAAEMQPFLFKEGLNSNELIKEYIKNEIVKLDNALETLLESWQGKQKALLNTIPCLGKRAVSYLISYTDGFTKIKNHRQLIALAGLAPREYSSGTSVSGRKRICRMGNRDLRKILYMCSLNAMRYNKGCKKLYDRLKQNGKPSKVALIAVCNKLLKQAFAIATSGIPYNEDHKSELVTRTTDTVSPIHML